MTPAEIELCARAEWPVLFAKAIAVEAARFEKEKAVREEAAKRGARRRARRSIRAPGPPPTLLLEEPDPLPAGATLEPRAMTVRDLGGDAQRVVGLEHVVATLEHAARHFAELARRSHASSVVLGEVTAAGAELVLEVAFVVSASR